MAIHVSAQPKTDWRRALAPTAFLLPILIGGSFALNQTCNNVDGGATDLTVAAAGSPRGNWCSTVQSHSHWTLIMVFAALVTTGLGFRAARRDSQWLMIAAWLVGLLIALAPAVISGALSPLEPNI